MSALVERISRLSPARLALLALELQEKLDTFEKKNREPIAIVGMACRLPGGADTPEQLWELLRNGVDAISVVPDRFDVDEVYDPDITTPGRTVTRWGGFIQGVDLFDAALFGITPREAMSLDPQQRLLLETVWEALEDGGIAPDGLHDTPTGVFVGIGTSDYAQVLSQAGSLADIDAYRGTGCISHSPASGRIAYALGLRGPAISVDTACSASLVAVHLACQALRAGECRMALAGGVNVILTPDLFIAHSKAGMMAPDGRCKTFDARADGWVRAEGCGVVALKNLSDAEADGDRVLAVIRGSAVNQDGRSNGLTAPNGPAQEAVIRDALTRGAVSVDDISYVETHGTGTELGDPIELHAVGAVLCGGRSADDALDVGSLKANLGHLEAAAGVASLIKVVLSLRHRTLPPQLHFSTPNPHIDWARFPLRVPTTPSEWRPRNGRRIGGVSSFGFSGTNAHVVVEEAPAVERVRPAVERAGHVLTLAGKSDAAVRALAARYAAQLAEPGAAELGDVCFTANVGRAQLAERVAVVAESAAEARARLLGVAAGEPATGVVRGTVRGSTRPRVAWLFTGQGAQYPGMGRALYETAPVFRAALERCDAALRGELATPLLDVLYGAAGARIHETAYTQPALCAVEYALAELWRSWGVEPGAVLGHSIGEYVAACVAGVFPVETALRLVAARGRLMQALPADGAMAAVLAPVATVAPLVAAQPEVSLAAVNGPAAVVIAGRAAGVAAVCAALAARGVECQPLAVSHAFHSPLLEPMLDAFAAVAATVAYAAPRLPVVSNVTGQFARGAELVTAGYWRTHARQPVQFAAGVQLLAAEGFDTLVEVGPQATLTQLGRRCVPAAGVWLGPSLQRDRAAWPQLLETLAALWVRGVPVDWAGFDRPYGRRKVALPTYPFQRQRYWIDTRPGGADSTEYSPAQRDAVPPPELVPDDLLYGIEWLPKPHAAFDETSAVLRTNGHGAPREAVLILADRDGVGVQLAERLERAGVSCWIAHTADTGAGSSRGRLCVGPGGRSEWLAALSTIAAARAHLRAVVSLWPLDLASLDSDSSGFVAEHTRSLITHAHLTSALTEAPAARAARLWLVTRGAQAVPEHTDAIHAGQAAFWGWGRVSRLEHPDTWGGIIDLSAAADTEEPIFIATEILAPDGEDQVARRASRRHVARLARMTMPVPSDGIALNPDAAYLVTGGLGAIGLRVAAWLADHGARHLALVSRRGVAERMSTSEAATTLETLRRRGIDARVFPADVADTGALSAVLDAIRAGGFPLRGVVHAAGLVTPSLIADLNIAVIDETFSAKVGGALCLDRATAGDQLDFFILFSAAAGVIGSEGLAHYAAANHVLDALAHQRRSRGAAALSLDWGRWDVTSGMLSAAGHRWFDHVGLRAIAPARALRAMEGLLRGGATQSAVLDVTPSFFAEMAARTNPAFLDLLAAPAQQAGTRKGTADVLQYLHARVADAIRMDRAAIGLDDPVNLLGFDSIMALEVRNRLHREFGVTVSMGDFLNGASIRSLAESVRLQLASQPAEPRLDRRGTAGNAQADDVSINPDDLSDAEVDAMLKRVLANEVR